MERDVAGWVNLLVRKPCRDKKKITGLQRCVKLPPLTPPNLRRAAEDIGDGVLLSVVVDSGAGSRFDYEDAIERPN